MSNFEVADSILNSPFETPREHSWQVSDTPRLIFSTAGA